jgi:hypothetical protein
MKWLDYIMFWRRDYEGRHVRSNIEEANRLERQLDRQAPEVRKLTHSLLMQGQINHLAERIRKAYGRADES